MAEHSHTHEEVPERPTPPETPLDPGSQALAEALRSSFGIVKVVMVLLVAAFLCSGVFKVGPDERAIKLRFGNPVGQGEKALLEPGLHWSFPYPIEDYVKVSVTGVKKAISTAGWYAVTPEQELAGVEPLPNATLNPAVDGYVLTADRNIMHARATLDYHVDDPVTYVFQFVNATNAVQNALDNALLTAASQFTADEILTRDVVGFTEAVRKRVSQLVEQQRLGVVVEQCSVQRAPPRQIKDAFENVLRAEVSRSKTLNEAHSYENQVLSKATADARSRVNSAESDRARYVNDLSANARGFEELLPRYRENPRLFVQQRITDTFGRVLTNAQDKIFLTEGGAGVPKELRLLLNRENPKRSEEPKP